MENNELAQLYTTVDVATADADGYRNGRQSLLPLVAELTELLEGAAAWIGNKDKAERAEVALAKAKEALGVEP